MCVSCFSGAEAVLLNAAGVVAIAVEGRDRWRDRLSPSAFESRRQRHRDTDAAFLRSLDLDPDEVLGPR